MKKKKNPEKKFKGLPFLFAVFILYAVLYFFEPERITVCVRQWGKNLLLLLPVFAFVIFLTALIVYYFPKQKIAKMLKGKSRIKSYNISLLAGIISHGPIFAWYPLLQELQQSGWSKGGLVTFIYGKSVKLTLLPLMIGFFGLGYTLIFSLYISAGALVQGFLFDQIDKHFMKSVAEIPAKNISQKTRTKYKKR